MAHKRHNKYQKKMFWAKAGIVVCVLVLVLFGGNAIAKYYSLQKQKGVAVASDFHFSSDILKNGMTLNAQGVPETIISYVKGNGWSEGGGTSTIRFQIQNYQNRLLYNDADIEIHYDVYAMLKEADTSGIKYALQSGEKTVEITEFTTPTVVFANQILAGGEMLEQHYNLIYDNTVKSETVPKEVYVWVVPTSPTYMDPNLYMRGASLSVVGGSVAFSFLDGFSIPLQASDDLLTEAEKNLINSQIGLVYNISTSGIYEESVNKDVVPVRLKWNSRYVEMDKFSEFYQNATADANGWKTIDIDFQTYSSNDIIFYRTKEFSFTSVSTPNEFLNLVQVELR